MARMPGKYLTLSIINQHFQEWKKDSPNTAFVGHNSVEFDEPVLENNLFTNLFNPYITRPNRGDTLNLARGLYAINSSKININAAITEEILDRFDSIRHNVGEISTAEVRTKMQHIMQQKCAVFRTHDLISQGIKDFEQLETKMNNINVEDKSLIFNTDLAETLELHNLMAQSKVTLYSALNRKETRGAHAREDFKDRDDENWLVHSLVWLSKNGDVRLGTRPVHMNTLTNHVQSIPPKKRVY